MTVILAKEEDDMRKGRARSISMLTNQTNPQKRKFTSNVSSDHKPLKKKVVNTKGKGQGQGQDGPSSSGHKDEMFKGKCNFCHKFGHKKADCRKLKSYLDKKGNCIVMVCLEFNIIDVPSNTWWLDTGATIHVTNSLQAVISRRRPSSLEQYVYMGDGTKVQVEFLGDCRFQLNKDILWSYMM